ncbi:MAG TPA: ABC transporter permease [Dongiaceae bacterium]|nr:ABC transporter permease [Dongiaceae bacterium]
MTRFILQRLGETALVLLLMSYVIYGLIGLMPGDPIDLMIASDPALTPADAVRLKAVYGLDRPLHERYAAWIGAAFEGDFGYSRLHARPVLEVLWPRLGNTALLMGTSFVLALALALPAGVFAALRPHSPADHLVNLAAFAGISMPPFWLAILLIILFAVVLGVLPAGGTATVGDGGFIDRARHLALPVATLTLVSAGALVRYVRAAMLEALRQDYVRTARAKGVGPARLVIGHALRNAMIPVVTILALDFGGLFSGALVTETMFAYLGMGKTIFDAIMGNDYNLALVGLLFATAVVLLSNLAADLAYAWLDPRIAYR